MIGVTLEPTRDAAAVASRALEAGLVINAPGSRMLRLLPPLIIDEDDVDRAVALLAASIR